MWLGTMAIVLGHSGDEQRENCFREDRRAPDIPGPREDLHVGDKAVVRVVGTIHL